MDGNGVANVQIPLPDTFTDLQRLSLGATRYENNIILLILSSNDRL